MYQINPFLITNEFKFPNQIAKSMQHKNNEQSKETKTKDLHKHT